MVNQGSLFILFSKSNRPSTYCELLLSHDWERLLPEGKEKKVVWTSTKQISPHLVEMNSEGAFWRNNFWTMYILHIHSDSMDYNYLRKTQGQLDILTLFQNSFQQVVLAESSKETYLLDGAYIKYFFSLKFEPWPGNVWKLSTNCVCHKTLLCLRTFYDVCCSNRNRTCRCVCGHRDVGTSKFWQPP